jgi:hypothetical protein
MISSIWRFEKSEREIVVWRESSKQLSSNHFARVRLASTIDGRLVTTGIR